jgi:CRP-like cAMP-binding protein
MKIGDALEDLSLFSDLTEQELLLIEPLCSVIEGKAGDVIIQEGKVITNLFILLGGKASIKKKRADGEQVEVAAAGKNDLLGEVTFLKMPPASATVEATSPFKALVLNQTALRRVLHAHPALGCKVYRKFARVLCRRLIRLTNQVAERLPTKGS